MFEPEFWEGEVVERELKLDRSATDYSWEILGAKEAKVD